MHVWKIQVNKLKQITNMQTNSPPKLDKSKKIYILPLSKTILSFPKQNILKQDSHISSISPPFCLVLTKTTQIKSKQKTYVTKVKRK